MKPGFSEFSYGFAYTDALIRKSGTPMAAPFLPSLRKEAILGFDVRLDYPGRAIFRQFKLSDKLVRPDARFWTCHGESYYLIDITPLTRSFQHNLLKKLDERLANELGDYRKEDICYAAPLFYKIDQFNDAYIAQEILERSISIPVKDLRYLCDNDSHYVTFTDASDFFWHTTPEGELRNGDFLAAHVYERIRSRFNQEIPQTTIAEYVMMIRGILVEVLSDSGYAGIPTPILQVHDTGDVNVQTIWEVRHLLTTYFGLEMILLFQSDQTVQTN